MSEQGVTNLLARPAAVNHRLEISQHLARPNAIDESQL
jgi:hypothetical protein